MNSKLIEDLKTLIGFETVSKDHDANTAAFNWVKDQLNGLPVIIKDLEFNGFPSLLIKTREGVADVCLSAHMDVVKGRVRLFDPKEKEGKLYGRGAYDMKFAIAAYLSVLANLGENLPNYNFDILLTSDEELGGFSGVGKIIDEGYSVRNCICPDGGEDWKCEKFSKGVLQYLIKSKGKASHSSRPWEGSNAINSLMSFLQELQKKFPEEPCSDVFHCHDSLNIGLISGGKVVNQIPPSARAKIDIRSTPGTTVLKIDALLQETAKRYPMISFQKLANGPSYSINVNNPYYGILTEIIKQKTGVGKKFVISHGSSDARFFAYKNIPVFNFRPPGGGLHGDGEWIDLEGLDKFTQIIEEYVKKVAKR